MVQFVSDQQQIGIPNGYTELWPLTSSQSEAELGVIVDVSWHRWLVAKSIANYCSLFKELTPVHSRADTDGCSGRLRLVGTALNSDPARVFFITRMTQTCTHHHTHARMESLFTTCLFCFFRSREICFANILVYLQKHKEDKRSRQKIYIKIKFIYSFSHLKLPLNFLFTVCQIPRITVSW